MKRNIKNIVFGMTLTAMVLGNTMVSMAGSWKSDAKGYWWQNDDGSYPTNCWQWLDGDKNGIAECYYFGADGYCYLNSMTPDQYQVNESGAWVVNGVVQTKQAAQVSQYTLDANGKLPRNAYENEKNRKAAAAYYQALKNQNRFAAADKQYSYVTIIDADQDGVVELLVNVGDGNEEVDDYYLFSYSDSLSIEKLDGHNLEAGQVPNEKKVIIYDAHESPLTGYEYTVENGQFKKGTSLFLKMNEARDKVLGDEYSKAAFFNMIELAYIRFAQLGSQNDLLYPSAVSSYSSIPKGYFY